MFKIFIKPFDRCATQAPTDLINFLSTLDCQSSCPILIWAQTWICQTSTLCLLARASHRDLSEVVLRSLNSYFSHNSGQLSTISFHNSTSSWPVLVSIWKSFTTRTKNKMHQATLITLFISLPLFNNQVCALWFADTSLFSPPPPPNAISDTQPFNVAQTNSELVQIGKQNFKPEVVETKQTNLSADSDGRQQVSSILFYLKSSRRRINRSKWKSFRPTGQLLVGHRISSSWKKVFCQFIMDLG